MGRIAAGSHQYVDKSGREGDNPVLSAQLGRYSIGRDCLY